MIEIKNLTKKYGALTVYENFNLQIEEGQTTCILGESGSGKTTLLNCVANLTDYVGQIPALKCAYVFQTPRLVPNLTVGGNLKLICKDDGKVDAILNRVHLYDKKNAYPKFLSGGQAQRASIARAFLYDGDVILLDEPFNSLDLKLKREISSLFSEIRQEKNATALFVTHDVDEALDLSHRIIIIKDGIIACDVKTDGEDKDELRKRLISALIA
ncbi:MAG: ATP-binding cassette domain-containing protein [Clostridia bacterium]|nr:ATP-binding cassette domain-containing protein [Clostridia bacterium]